MKRALMVAVMALAACSGAKKDPPKISLSFQAQLDSGNAAYRRGDYKTANEYYHAAAKSEPTNISGFYGIYMAETKLGNTVAAAQAQATVAKLAPDMPVTAHPTAADKQKSASDSTANPHAGMMK